ncbi:MTA/SAH nucleosidase [Streptococcus dysgalactiae]|nr:MTA/SAH nucleosidase [Streptococcus dysgalactiae]
MKIGIIAAMEQELVLLVEQLENKVEETVLGNTYYTGRLGKHDVVWYNQVLVRLCQPCLWLSWQTILALMPSLTLVLQEQ